MRTPDINWLWLTKRRAAAEPPAEVYIALVASLFGMLQALYMSVCGVLCVSVKTYLDAPSPLLLAITVFLTFTGAARIVTNHQFEKTDRASWTKEIAQIWERHFAIWACSFTAGMGLLLFVTFTGVNYWPDHLLVEAVSCGIAVGITARNAARPRIAPNADYLAGRSDDLGLVLAPGDQLQHPWRPRRSIPHRHPRKWCG